ncbi:GxxExxY protein [Lewinella sp. IMCC34183]|uniref:GxxExxY protein n=1 Tax=Lewinella sp. IMCC34183 TaxID=2248762 RepID=UPI0029393386|nr:GxxExxY protein [Lewinella sp. IMCC34183]
MCLARELTKQGMHVERQRVLPVHYDGIDLKIGYLLDLVVDNRLIVELKAAKQLTPTDAAQLLTYMKLS